MKPTAMVKKYDYNKVENAVYRIEVKSKWKKEKQAA